MRYVWTAQELWHAPPQPEFWSLETDRHIILSSLIHFQNQGPISTSTFKSNYSKLLLITAAILTSMNLSQTN